jgi:molecular chaperone GrpE (heat shock protein)
VEVEDLTPRIAELESKIAEQDQKLLEANEKFLRMAADFDNYRNGGKRKLATSLSMPAKKSYEISYQFSMIWNGLTTMLP